MANTLVAANGVAWSSYQVAKAQHESAAWTATSTAYLAWQDNVGNLEIGYQTARRGLFGTYATQSASFEQQFGLQSASSIRAAVQDLAPTANSFFEQLAQTAHDYRLQLAQADYHHAIEWADIDRDNIIEDGVDVWGRRNAADTAQDNAITSAENRFRSAANPLETRVRQDLATRIFQLGEGVGSLFVGLSTQLANLKDQYSQDIADLYYDPGNAGGSLEGALAQASHDYDLVEANDIVAQMGLLKTSLVGTPSAPWGTFIESITNSRQLAFFSAQTITTQSQPFDSLSLYAKNQRMDFAASQVDRTTDMAGLEASEQFGQAQTHFHTLLADLGGALAADQVLPLGDRALPVTLEVPSFADYAERFDRLVDFPSQFAGQLDNAFDAIVNSHGWYGWGWSLRWGGHPAFAGYGASCFSAANALCGLSWPLTYHLGFNYIYGGWYGGFGAPLGSYGGVSSGYASYGWGPSWSGYGGWHYLWGYGGYWNGYGYGSAYQSSNNAWWGNRMLANGGINQNVNVSPESLIDIYNATVDEELGEVDEVVDAIADSDHRPIIDINADTGGALIQSGGASANLPPDAQGIMPQGDTRSMRPIEGLSRELGTSVAENLASPVNAASKPERSEAQKFVEEESTLERDVNSAAASEVWEITNDPKSPGVAALRRLKVPATTIDKMFEDGLVQFATQIQTVRHDINWWSLGRGPNPPFDSHVDNNDVAEKKYAVVTTASGNGVMTIVLQQRVREKVRWVRSGGEYFPIPIGKEEYYEVVHTSLLPLSNLPASARTLDSIQRMIQSRQTQTRVNSFATAAHLDGQVRYWNNVAAAGTFVLHMIPTGGGLDHAVNGDYGEAAISFVGDAALLIGGPLAKTAQGAGAVRTARGLQVTAISIEGSVAGGRVVQGGFALQDGRTGDAAGYFGDAFLRLIGVGLQVRAVRASGASTKLFGAAQGPHRSFARNVGNVARTADEAQAIYENALRNAGDVAELNPRLNQADFSVPDNVKIVVLSDDDFVSALPRDIRTKVRNGEISVDARYGNQYSSTDTVRWRDLLEPDGTMRVVVRESVMRSDQKLISTLAHEFVEINAIREFFEYSPSTTGARLWDMMRGGRPNNEHAFAWDASNFLMDLLLGPGSE